MLIKHKITTITEVVVMDLQGLILKKESLISQINYTKAERSREYDYAHSCYEERRFDEASNHSYNARALSDTINSLYSELEDVKREIQCIYDERNNSWRYTTCQSCGRQIKYHVDWTNVPNLCKDCLEKEKAKWRTKSCNNCGNTIRYNVDWTNVPNLCKDCLEKEKAKWRTKSCNNCGNTIKYNIDWTNVPSLCNNCKLSYKEAICVDCHEKFIFDKRLYPNRKRCDSCKNAVRFRVRANIGRGWRIQDENEDALILVSDNYLERNPHIAAKKSNGIMQERTDILVFDYDTNTHKHFGSESDTNFKLSDYHKWKK